MNEHPIENLMITAMSSIQNMVDVNTIIGEPIETQVGITIIPISKVSFGFAAGGSEFRGETLKEYNKKDFLCFFRILPKIPKSFQILLSSLHYKLNDNSKTN